MNPSVPQRVIDAALEEDQPRAQVEWFAQFRSDVESFVKRETVEVCGARLLAGRKLLTISSTHIHHNRTRAVQGRWSTIDRNALFGLPLGRGKLRRDPLDKGAHRAALSAGARKDEIMAHVADID